MSLSTRYLFAVAVLAGTFETLSAVWLEGSDLAGRLSAGAFGIALLGCAWAVWARRSFMAATVVGLLLAVDVACIPFYERSTWADWALQVVFGVVGAVGIAAWVQLLRTRRSRRGPVSAVRG